MAEQATEVTTEEVTPEVQPVSEEDLLDNIADGLLEEEPEAEEDHPEEEVKEEKPEPEPEKKETPELHKVKVDGEEQEVSYEELVRGYQTNRHNTQTAQSLADERRQLAPIIGLAKRLQDDKDFAQHVFSFGKQEESDDPIEKIKREAKAETLKEVDAKREEDRKREHFNKIREVESEMMKDPDFEKVKGMMKERIESMPKHLQQNEAYALNYDIGYFQSVYKELKETLKPKEEPEPKKPPVLVESGSTKETPVQSIKKQKLDKKKAKVLASGDLDALEDWMSSDGGLIDSLGL